MIETLNPDPAARLLIPTILILSYVFSFLAFHIFLDMHYYNIIVQISNILKLLNRLNLNSFCGHYLFSFFLFVNG